MDTHRDKLLVLVRASAAALAGCALTLVSTAAPAGARPEPSACPPDSSTPYPPGACHLETDRTTVAAGEDIEVSGCGFKPGSRVTLVLRNQDSAGHHRSLGTLRADESGCIDDDVTVRGNTDPGTYRILATGMDPGNRRYRLVSDPITVTAPASQAALASSSTQPVTEALVGALALGFLVVGSLVVRRARRSTAA